MFLNQCRSIHAIAAAQTCSLENRRGDKSVCAKEHILFRPQGFFRRLGLPFADGVPGWLAHAAKHSGAQTDEVCRLAGSRGAITNGVDLIEPSLDGVPMLVRKKVAREFNRDRVFLPDVTQVGRALYDDRVRADG